jgi:hypothetical protein
MVLSVFVRAGHPQSQKRIGGRKEGNEHNFEKGVKDLFENKL